MIDTHSHHPNNRYKIITKRYGKKHKHKGKRNINSHT